MRRGAVAILILAATLRFMRAVCRWDEWGLHYAAYNLPTYEALQTDAYLEMFTTWVGLHPPLYPILHSMGSILWPTPALWLIFSACCSLIAVCFLLAAHPNSLLPAFLLATDPVQLHYAAEVNNYPLSVMLIAGAWWGFKSNRPYAIAIAGCLAVWTHIMAGVAVFSLAMVHEKRFKILVPMALSAVPLLGTAWVLASDAGSQRQPPLLLETSIRDAINRFSIGWIMMFPILLLGLVREKAAAVAWATCMAFWIFTVSLGIAAPHQFPYATILGTFSAALLAAATAQRPMLAGVVILVATSRAAWFGVSDAGRLHAISNDQSTFRGVDAVWQLSLPGDAIVLVRGPGAPDDDKRHYSPTLWRLSPFQHMLPLSTGVRPDLVGQPRMVNGRRLYTFGHPRDAIGAIPGAHVFTVLYDGAEQNPERIPHHPKQGAWEQAGPDLWRGPALMVEDSEANDEQGAEGSDASPPDPPALD